MAETSPVYVCTWDLGRDGLPAALEELLTLGRRASRALGSDLVWLVLGPLPEGARELAASHGVATIDHLEDPRLESFQPDLTVEALSQAAAQSLPRLWLVAQTPEARLLAPRLAGRLDWAVVMNGLDLGGEPEGPLQITTSAYGGDTRAIYELVTDRPCIVALMPNAVTPERLETPGPSPELRPVRVELEGVEERIQVVRAARAEGPQLEDAEIIVAGGRGLGSPENYKLIEELAEALGGQAGASRPVVDEGWVDSSRQVGLTGKITRPALYIAAGISGASQHMAGCSAAKTLVAINRDPDASIFRYARFGIVGDCLEILPELIRAVRES